MTGSEVLEQVFQDRDSDDSDIELGEAGSDGEDVASDEEPICVLLPMMMNMMTSTSTSTIVSWTSPSTTQPQATAMTMTTLVPPYWSYGDWTSSGRAGGKCGKERVQPQRLNVKRQQQVLVDTPDNRSPSDFFKLYVTDELLDVTALETPLSFSLTTFVAEPHSLVHKWKDTDRDEMAVLLGVMLRMSLVYKPRLSMYWSTEISCFTYRPIFSSVMPRDRFLILIRFLHFADNLACDVSNPARDRLHKIWPVIDLVKQRCREVY